MSDSEQLLKHIEEACTLLQHPQFRAQAEQVLVDFKQSATVIQTALQLMTQSQVSFAQFHAAIALREASMKQWEEMKVGEQEQLIGLVMDYIVGHFDQVEAYVGGQLLRLAAAMYKRGWMQRKETQVHQFLEQMAQLCHVNTVLAMKLLTVVVSEFGSSASNTTAMHMPMEFHIRVKDAFTQGALVPLATMAFQALDELTKAMVVSSSSSNSTGTDDFAALRATLELVVELVHWDFQMNTSDILSTWEKKSSDTSSSSFRILYPGKRWKSILIQPTLVTHCFHAYVVLRHQEEGRPSCSNTSNHARSHSLHLLQQLFIQFGSLSGEIFDTKDEKVTFLVHVYHGMLQLYQPRTSTEAGGDHEGQEMQAICQFLVQMITNLRLALLRECHILSSVVQSLTKLTLDVLASIREQLTHNPLDCDDILSSRWEWSCFDQAMLEAWSVLVTDAAAAAADSHSTSGLEEDVLLSQCTFQVFESYVHLRLLVAKSEVLQEAEEDEDEDQIEAAAAQVRETMEAMAELARVSASASLPFLHTTIHQCFQMYQSQLTSSASGEITLNLSQVMEQMHFVLGMIGLTLSDGASSESETTQNEIPSFVCPPTSQSHLHAHIYALIRMCGEILTFESSRVFASNSTTGIMTQSLSPFVSEQLIVTMTRVASVYYTAEFFHTLGTPEPSLASHVYQLLESTCIYLSRWPSEHTLMHHVAFMIKTLSRSKATAEWIIQQPMWFQLCTSLTSAPSSLSASSSSSSSCENSYARLDLNTRKLFIEGMCRMGTMTTSTNQRTTNYFQSIAEPVQQRLNVMTSTLANNKKGDLVNDIRLQEEIQLILALYTGLGMATEVSNHADIGAFSLAALPSWIKIMDLFHTSNQIVTAILTYLNEFVESQITYLSPTVARRVYELCGETLVSYSRHNLGRVSFVTNAEEESFQDLFQLMTLLSHLISKDFIDFAEEEQRPPPHLESSNAPPVAVADVVFFGLGIVIPLMTEKLLEYPSLCAQYFMLVSFMVEVYPQKLATLDPALFSRLMTSLAYGVKHVQFDITKYSLQALSEMVGFHHKALLNDEPGLCVQLHGSPQMLIQFLQDLLQGVLFEVYRPNLLIPYASAILPLILVAPVQFEQLAQTLAQTQAVPANQQRLFQLLGSLMHPSEGRMWSLQRQDRVAFRKVFREFVTKARGLIQLR